MPQVIAAPRTLPTANATTGERPERAIASAAGVLGALLLVAYFAAPAILDWPYAGASPTAIVQYADSHAALFYAGAWLQVTGTLLCVILFLALVQLSHAVLGLTGMVASMAAAVLLATVVIEAAFLVAVPVAAANGDSGTAASMFALSNGVFLRVFPLAPASATLIGLGLVLRRSNLLGSTLAVVALGLGVAFELGGIAAIAVPGALALLAILSAGQALWVIAASIRLGTSGQATASGSKAAA